MCVLMRQDPGAVCNLDIPILWVVQEGAGIRVGPVCVVGRQLASGYGRLYMLVQIGDLSFCLQV